MALLIEDHRYAFLHVLRNAPQAIQNTDDETIYAYIREACPAMRIPMDIDAYLPVIKQQIFGYTAHALLGAGAPRFLWYALARSACSTLPD